MRLDLIENSGPDNLRDTLKAQISHASEVSIAVAFITQAGLDEIVQPLQQVATNGKVRLLTGLYQKFTEPRALRTLCRLQRQTQGRLSVRLSREPQFHRKLYVLTNRVYATAILGSSNLTQDGLRSGGELNLMMRLPTNSVVFKKMAKAFDNDWEHRAVPLTREQIVEYEKDRETVPAQKSFTSKQLKTILGVSPSHSEARADGQDPPERFWRDCVTGIAAKRTQQVISDTTNWDEKGYSWYSLGGVHPYANGDRILLFDFYDERVRLVKVRGIAHTKVATPDGRHFVAYRPLAKAEWRFSKGLWAALRDEGINRTTARKRRKLSLQKAEHLKILMRSVRRRKRRSRT
ncbi:MAG: phospholipase D-like domain-containing protein [Solirubrobacterales bacterium]